LPQKAAGALRLLDDKLHERMPAPTDKDVFSTLGGCNELGELGFGFVHVGGDHS
jgi:hypothetical protein